MNWQKWAPWIVVALAAWLIGYWPQRKEIGRLRTDIANSASAMKTLEQRVDDLQFKLRLADLRDLASLMYLETSRRNFGIAQKRATRFFTAVGDLARDTTDQGLKSRLEAALAERDRVTASLAKADGSSAGATLELLEQIHEKLEGQ